MSAADLHEMPPRTADRRWARRAGQRGPAFDYHSARAWERLAELLSRVEPWPDLHCGRVHCEPGWHWRPRLRDHDLWLAVSGKGRFVLQKRTYRILPGTLFWLRPGDEGFATQDPEQRLTVVYMHFTFRYSGSGEAAELDPSELPARHIRLADPGRIEALLSRAVRLMHFPGALGHIEARLLLRQVILEIYRQDAAQAGAFEPGPDPRVARVIAQLRARPAARLSLSEAAAMAELSPEYFSHIFKAETGMTFRRYVVEARIERARQLLDETGMSVTEIANALGYDDLALFSRQFKAYCGVPPTAWRRSSSA
ncbi:MAG TPA: AraC family transcriptional regulator [Limnochordia bacterium]